MGNRKLWIGIITLFCIIILNNCKMNADPTYTIWTDSGSYTDYSSVFGTLYDGYYLKMELSNSDFNSMSLSNEYKHNWTENEIYNWFLGRNFISSEANELKAWVITVNHCIIASRSGEIVYMLIK